MATGYVVTEIGYEYNDEIYYQSENGGGRPVRVFLDKAKAQDEVEKMNFEALMGCEIGSYAYDLSDIVSNMDVFTKIIKKYMTEDDSVDVEDSYELGEWFSSHASKFSQADQKKIAKLVTLEFYSLTEVEIDDSVLQPKPETKEKKKFSNLDD